MSSYEDILEDTAQAIKANDLAVFCGAGISIGSGIPGVMTIVEYILQQLGMGEADRRLFVDPKKNILTDPFEVFIERLLEAGNEDEEAIFKLFEMFNSDHLRPNTYHWFLAALAKAGRVKTIFTTNFDCLIEDALKDKGVAYEPLYREEDFPSLTIPSDKVRVIKIHGSVHDKKSMVSTIRRLSQEELRYRRNTAVEDCYSLGKHKQVMVLGYSCSDIFDITPQIERIEANFKKVIFIDHHDADPKVEPLPQKKEKNPFRRFQNSQCVYCHTGLFIQSLWRKVEEDIGEKYHEEWYGKNETRTSAFACSTRENLSPLFYTVEAGADSKLVPQTNAKVLETWKQSVTEWIKGIFPDAVRGILFYEHGEYDKAIEAYQQALAICRKVLGEEHPETATSYNNLGLVYYSKGEYDLALEYCQKALAICRKALGEEHPSTATSYNNLGAVYYSKSKYPKAIEYYEKALAIYRKVLGEEHPETATSYNSLGLVYHSKGEYDLALEYHQKALAIYRKALGEEHPSTAMSYNNLGQAYYSKGEYPQAIEYFQQALAIFRKNFPNGHPHIAIVSDSLRRARSKRG